MTIKPTLSLLLRAGAALAVLWTIGFAALAEGVIGLERIVITVSDLDRAERFYRDGLGFETIGRGEAAGDGFAHLVGLRNSRARTLSMRLGRDEVTFAEYEPLGKPYPAASGSPDLWFQHFAIVVSDMDRAYARLQRVGFAPISEAGPVTLPPANGSVRAFKFRDPDGHPLELLYFPPGEGRAVWSESADRLFLGVDHSAIGVADTARSEGFYENLLGMAVAYRSVNRGPTQESLDGTFGAVVQITGLRPPAQSGPGVEFLEYRTPATGRPRRSTRNPTTSSMSSCRSRWTISTASSRSSGARTLPSFRPTRWIWATARARRWSAIRTDTRLCWSSAGADGLEPGFVRARPRRRISGVAPG